LDNGYSLELTFSSIRKRLSTKFHQISNKVKYSSTLSNKENYFVISYINHTAKKYIQYFKNILSLSSMGLTN